MPLLALCVAVHLAVPFSTPRVDLQDAPPVPNEPDSILERADVAFQAGRLREGAELLAGAAAALSAEGELARALAAYRSALQWLGQNQGVELPLRLQLTESGLACARRLAGEAPHSELVWMLSHRARVLVEAQQMAAAGPLLAEALAAGRELYPEGHLDLANAIALEGHRLLSEGRPDLADDLYEESLAMLTMLEGDVGADIARSLSGLASCRHEQGRLPDALALFEECLAMLEEVHGEDHPEVAMCHGDIAVVLKYQGRFDEALPHYEVAREVLGRLFGAHLFVAQTLNNEATCRLAMGQFEPALERFEQALAICESLEVERHPIPMISMDGIAQVRAYRGEYALAVEGHREALAIALELYPSGHPFLATLLSNLAQGLLEIGDFAAALPLCRDALEMFEQVSSGPNPRLGSGHLNLGFCLQSLGRHDEALEQFYAGFEVWRAVYAGDHADIALALNNIAASLSFQGREEEALPYYEEALGMYRRLFGELHADVARGEGNLGNCLEDLGQPQEATEHHRRALAILEELFSEDHPKVAQTRANLATALVADDQLEEALELLAAAVATGRRMALPEERIWLTSLGSLHQQAGRPEEARQCYRLAVALAEELRARASALDDIDRGQLFLELRREADPYGGLVLSSLDCGEIPGALRALELGRSRALLDLMERGNIDPLEVAERAALAAGDEERIAELRAAEQRTEARRAEAQRATERLRDAVEAGATDVGALQAALEGRLAELRDGLRERARLVEEHVRLARPCDEAELAGLPQEGERLLYYWLDRAGVRLFVVAPGGRVEHHELTLEREELTRLVERYLEQVARGGSVRGVPVSPGERAPDAPAVGLRLFAGLLPEAVWADVKDARRVIVVPDGALHRLPFESLPIGSEEGDSGPRYWLDGGPPVAYATSGSMLLECRRRRELDGPSERELRLVAVGNPAPSSVAGLDTLPGSEAEVRALQELFGPSEARVLVGAEATEEALRQLAPRARVLHLAAHFVVDESDSATGSALVLSPPAGEGEQDDGFLRISDLLDRWSGRLRGCELVVLSACESSGGEDQRDEGVLSAVWGFLHAGTSAVIVSQWPVDDARTAELMTSFYELWLGEDGMDKLDAFTEARRRLRARHPAPGDWAPFVFLGEPR